MEPNKLYINTEYESSDAWNLKITFLLQNWILKNKKTCKYTEYEYTGNANEISN